MKYNSICSYNTLRHILIGYTLKDGFGLSLQDQLVKILKRKALKTLQLLCGNPFHRETKPFMWSLKHNFKQQRQRFEELVFWLTVFFTLLQPVWDPFVSRNMTFYLKVSVKLYFIVCHLDPYVAFSAYTHFSKTFSITSFFLCFPLFQCSSHTSSPLVKD